MRSFAVVVVFQRLTTYPKSGRLLILRHMAIFRQLTIVRRVVTVECSFRLPGEAAMRFGLSVFFVSLVVSLAAAEGPKKAALVAACMDRETSYTTTDAVNFTVMIE